MVMTCLGELAVAVNKIGALKGAESEPWETGKVQGGAKLVGRTCLLHDLKTAMELSAVKILLSLISGR
jgi:hypothetical protein